LREELKKLLLGWGLLEFLSKKWSIYGLSYTHTMKDAFKCLPRGDLLGERKREKEENENEKPKERGEEALACNACNFILALAMGRSRPPWKQIHRNDKSIRPLHVLDRCKCHIAY